MLRICVGCSKEILKYALLSLENRACSELIRESRYGTYTVTRKYFLTTDICKLFRGVCLPQCRGAEKKNGFSGKKKYSKHLQKKFWALPEKKLKNFVDEKKNCSDIFSDTFQMILKKKKFRTCFVEIFSKFFFFQFVFKKVKEMISKMSILQWNIKGIRNKKK